MIKVLQIAHQFGFFNSEIAQQLNQTQNESIVTENEEETMGLEDHSNLYQPQKNSLLDTRLQPDQLEETVYSYLELESNTDRNVKPDTQHQLKQERAKTQQQASQLQSLQAQVDTLTKKFKATEQLLQNFSAGK
jgi:hypothetical protein